MQKEKQTTRWEEAVAVSRQMVKHTTHKKRKQRRGKAQWRKKSE